MCSELRRCKSDDALSEAARILWEHDCGIVPVVASDGSGRVEGVITDRDLCMAAYTTGRPLTETQVASVMSTRLVSVRPEDPIAEAAERMRTAQVRRLPVVDESGHLRGMLSLADLAESAVGRGPEVGIGPEEVGRLLAAICRPRTELVPVGAPGDPGEEAEPPAQED
jgi:CBS-domain-containing membrane protein